MTAVLPASPRELAPRLQRSPLLLMLDIDGTVAPLAQRPEEAAVPEATRRTILDLQASPGVHLAFVTGRPAESGRQLVQIEGAWVIGNHGIEMIDPSGRRTVDPKADEYRGDIAAAVAELTDLVGAIPGLLIENKVWTMSVHYRLADPAIEPRLRQTMDVVAHKYGLRLIRGKKIFELRPPIHVHKGTAVIELSRRLTGPRLGGALFYAGDDRTDEDAFRSLRSSAPHAVTVRVGASADDQTAATAAEFTVANEEALRSLLDWLLTVRR